MKLCHKCHEQFVKEIDPWLADKPVIRDYKIKLVPESECEFWAHVALNKFTDALGWKVLTSEEKEGLFAYFKREHPEGFARLEALILSSVFKS